jgi:phosphoglycerate dehydrogenase-like enzyme
VAFLGFGEAQARADLSGIRMYVPPYLGGDEVVRILDRLPDLEVVQLLTAGADWILDAIPAGVTVCSAKGVHEASTSELAMAGILAMVKNLPAFVRQQSDARWSHVRVGGLLGARAVVLGYGAIGSALGARLSAFGVDVRGVTRHGRDGTYALADLPGLLPECELLAITLPLTPHTTNLVDAAVLSRLPDDALVVNVARGPVIDQAALEVELVGGRLRAVLDVTVPEPLPAGSPLWGLDNVLITPHVGGDSTLFPRLAGAMVADQIGRFLDGQPLRNVLTGDY